MSDDEPGTGELKRLIERNHGETTSTIARVESQLAVAMAQMTAQFKDYVLKEVWTTERDAQREQLKEIKDEVTSARRRAVNAAWTAAGTFLGSLALIYFTKGAH